MARDPGREDEFVDAWRELAEFFMKLPQPPLWGRLLRSTAEPSVFYTFGPWAEPDDLAAMLAHPDRENAFARPYGCCDKVMPASCRRIAGFDERQMTS